MHVEDGMSGSEIARELGINNSSVVNAEITKAGARQNTRGKTPTEAEEVTE